MFLSSGTSHEAANERRQETEEEVFLFLVPTETTCSTTEWSRESSSGTETEVLLLSTSTSTSHGFGNTTLDSINATLNSHIDTFVEKATEEAKVLRLKVLGVHLFLEITHA